MLATDRDVAGMQASERLEPFAADLTDGAQVAAMVERCRSRFGRLDGAFNGAGISGRRYGDGPVDECTEEGWDTVLEANLKSVYWCCRHEVAALRAAGAGGSIVNLSSVLALVGGDGDFATHAYAASKGAIVSLTRAMAVTYAAERIRCNVLAPGLIATPMSSARAGRRPDPGAAARAAAADRRLRAAPRTWPGWPRSCSARTRPS